LKLKKDHIRHDIVNAAIDEFETKSFLDASMRNIAKKAEISVSNIYNYFKNKNELFEEITKDVTVSILNYYDIMESKEYLADQTHWSLESHLDFVSDVAHFIDKHRRVLKLLAFNSYGSSLENFRDQLIERYTNVFKVSLKLIKEAYPESNVDITDFFIHNMASFFLNTIIEILMHDLSLDESIFQLKEMMTFTYSGFEGVMGNSVCPKQ